MYFLRSRSGKTRPLGKPGKPIEVKPIQCPEGFNFQELLAQAHQVADASFLEGEGAETGPQERKTSSSFASQEAVEGLAACDAARLEGKEVGNWPQPKGIASGNLVEHEMAEGLARHETAERLADRGAPELKRSYGHAFPENKDISRSHRRRREKRNAQIAAQGHQPNSKALTSVLLSSDPVMTDLETSTLPATSCGFQALHYRPSSREAIDPKVKNLLSKGYTLIPSDPSVPRPFLDSEKRVIGAYCGRPDDPEYLDACARVYELFEEVGKDPSLMDEATDNRRGSFPVINVGITHGKGTHHPVNLHEGNDKPSKHEDTARRILQNPYLNRIAVFQSSCFKVWSPHVYHHYHQKLNGLYAERPNLRRNFLKSVFPCCAVNCGPKAWTCPHRDSMNLPHGMCAITSLGSFDHRTGGHLILPDLKLIVEFPVGSVMLIPSATLIHANVEVEEHESRASFTQFAAGGLFRYIENGFMTEKALKEKDKQKYASICAQKKTRWMEGLKLLSKFADLVDKQEIPQTIENTAM